jgi:biotin-dependent carboxylase-like uncharacterized protein
MPSALRVLRPGLLTTIQDLGRVGYQRLGVAVSGALDQVSLRAANILVGNTPGEGTLEVAYVGPTLVVDADSVRMACVGADVTIEILPDEAATNGRRVPAMRSFQASRGEVVRIGGLSGAAVLYLAIEGGFDIQPVLGSVSTFVRGKMGGWQGRPLAAGDKIPLRNSISADRRELQFKDLDLRRPARYRAVIGPQSSFFAEHAVKRLFEGEYTVKPKSDRMAMHLAGQKLDFVSGFDIVSDGIAAGSIQVPGHGEPIILLADRQTTGGYPKIATVISADLPALGRVRIGEKIRFEPVTIEAAQELRRKFLKTLETLRDSVAPVTRNADEVSANLFSSNLISGAIDAHSFHVTE